MRKACLFMISARNHLLKECLTYVDSNYNKKYNYLVTIKFLIDWCNFYVSVTVLDGC